MVNMPITNENKEPAIYSRVAWGAIFAGALLTLATLFFLGSFTLIMDYSGEGGGSFGIKLWATLVTVVATFAGGMATTKLAAGESVGEGIFHGIMVWSIVVSFLLYLAINGFLLLGSSIILGQSTDPFQELTRGGAFWGFAGVVLSLFSTLIGALMGTDTRSARRLAAPDRERERAPA